MSCSVLPWVFCLLRARCAGQAIQIFFVDAFCSWLFVFTEGRNTIPMTFLRLSNRYTFPLTLVAYCICVDFHAFVCFCFVLVFSCLSYALLFGSSLYFKLVRTDSAEYLVSFAFSAFVFPSGYFVPMLPILSSLYRYSYRILTATFLNLFR